MKCLRKIIGIVVSVIMVVSAVTIIPVSAASDIVNIFSQANAVMGYYDNSGTLVSDPGFYSSTQLSVAQGDVICFAPAEKAQGFHVTTYNSSDQVVGNMGLTGGVENVADIDSTYGIMKYTIPAGISSVRLICNTSQKNKYLVTKNRVFTVSEYNEYISNPKTLTNIFNNANAETGFYQNDGSHSPDGFFRSSELLAVTQGDVLCFGPAQTAQGFHVTTYDSAGKVTGNMGMKEGVEKVADIDSSYSIMKYTIPSGVSSIRLICNTSQAEKYLATKNREFTVAEYNEYFSTPVVTSVLNGKSALFCGDSISAGQWDDGTGVSNQIAWGGRIGRSYGMRWDNKSVGGQAISSVRGMGNRIVDQFASVKSNKYDYVILEGGVNDAWGNGDGNPGPLGKMTDSYNVADFDISTYAGALEELFYYAYKNWTGAKIGYIMTFAMPNASDIGGMAHIEEFFAEGAKICKKWGVEVMDMYHNDEINTAMDVKNRASRFLQDPIHPNGKGYDVLAPYVAKWMESLVGDGRLESAKGPFCNADNEQVLAPNSSLAGWTPYYSTAIYRTLEDENSIVINGEKATGYPTSGDSYVGAMATYKFPHSYDLSLSTTIKYDYYIGTDMTGIKGQLQMNFVSENIEGGNQDGYNTSVILNDLKAGWHTAELSTTNPAFAALEYHWESMKMIRVTWWNYGAALSGLNLKIKNIRLAGNKLLGKSALFCGDSISAGSNDHTYHYAWGGRIGDSNCMDVVNASESGWSLSNIRGARIIDQMRSANKRSYNYVILQGGVNDAWGDGVNYAQVGKMTQSYDPRDFDTTTYAGALEELFYFAYNLFPNTAIGYIINYRCPNADVGHVSDMTEYFTVGKEICKKWNVQYLDLYFNDYANNTLLSTSTAPNTYMADAVHPTPAGYDRLAPYVAGWMNGMVVNDISSFKDKMPDISEFYAKRPYGDKHTLNVFDGERLYGWTGYYDTTVSLSKERTILETSLCMVGIKPTEHHIANDRYIGSMACLGFNGSIDLSKYDTITYDFYLSRSMVGKTGELQLNFATVGQDGYNTAVDISGMEAGWHTAEIPMNHPACYATEFKWEEINQLRLTWWNLNACVDDLTVLFDNLCVHNLNDVMMYDVDYDEKITAIDALKDLRYSIGLEKFLLPQKKAGDINGDGNIDSADALAILKRSIGLD